MHVNHYIKLIAITLLLFLFSPAILFSMSSSQEKTVQQKTVLQRSCLKQRQTYQDLDGKLLKFLTKPLPSSLLGDPDTEKLLSFKGKIYADWEEFLAKNYKDQTTLVLAFLSGLGRHYDGTADLILSYDRKYQLNRRVRFEKE